MKTQADKEYAALVNQMLMIVNRCGKARETNETSFAELMEQLRSCA